LRRSGVLLAVLIFAGLAVMPPRADAQTLIPDVSGVLGIEKDSEPKPETSRSRCLPGPSLVCAVEEAVTGTVGVIGDAAGAGASVAADAVLGGVVAWAGTGAAWLLREIGSQVDRSTRPAVGSAWFARRYSSMRQLAISLSVLFLLAAIVNSVVRRDVVMLLRACFVALPLALLLTFAAVTLVELGLALTDGLTAAAVQGSGDDANAAFAGLGDLFGPDAATANPLPGLVLFLGALLAALLALVVWIELVLREAAIYVAVAFLPIGLSAITWHRTAHWARKLAEWLVAIILAKFVIAATFAIAGSMLGHARGGTGGLSALLAGCAVLLVAAMSPWVVLRLVPFAEQAAGSLSRAQLGSSLSSAPGATATSLLVRQAMMKNFGAGLAAGSGAAATKPSWPPTPPAGAGPAARSRGGQP
jgi:hypothetical protein